MSTTTAVLIVVMIAWAIMSFVRVQVRTVRVRVPRGSDPRHFDELRTQAEQAPSAANMLMLADALERGDMPSEAAELYRKVLASNEHDRDALHGLGRCLVDLGNPREGAHLLGKLMELDRAFRDYGAALDYAEALWQAGQREDAVAFTEAMAAHTQRINHWVAAAHYATLAGETARARSALQRGLQDWERSAAEDKARRTRWERRARSMLQQLDLHAEP